MFDRLISINRYHGRLLWDMAFYEIYETPMDDNNDLLPFDSTSFYRWRRKTQCLDVTKHLPRKKQKAFDKLQR